MSVALASLGASMFGHAGSGALASGVGSAIGSLGAGLAGSALSTYQQQMLMKYQAKLNYKYAQKQALNSPTWNRQGLEGAGYNPMLAVQNATAGANSNWSGLNSAQSPDLLQARNSNIANQHDAQRLDNETAQTEANVEQAQATARKENAIASNEEERNPYISQSEQANLDKLDAATLKLNRETDYYDALEENMKQQIRIQHEANALDYSARIYGANTSYNATKYHADVSKQIADEHSPSGKSISFKNYMEGVSGPLHGIGSILHAGNGRNYSDESIEQSYDKYGNIKGVKTKSKTRKK